MYRSSVDPESEVDIMKMESKISRRNDTKKIGKVNEVIRDWEKARNVGTKRTKIIQLRRALKDSAKSFKVRVVNNKDPLQELNVARSGIGYHLKKELNELKGMKYAETLKITFEKQLDKDKTTFKTAYFNNKESIVIHENEINYVLRVASEQITNTIA